MVVVRTVMVALRVIVMMVVAVRVAVIVVMVIMAVALALAGIDMAEGQFLLHSAFEPGRVGAAANRAHVRSPPYP